jgi:hypothetical protein
MRRIASAAAPKKVRAVLPRLSGRIDELEPRFVDERGGLECVAGGQDASFSFFELRYSKPPGLPCGS